MSRHEDINALIFTETQDGRVILVLEASKPRPWRWKLPSEKNELFSGTSTHVYVESPEETAWRGLYEEAGIDAQPASFRKIAVRRLPNRIREGTHRQYLFAVTLDAVPDLPKRIVRQDGEEVEIFLPRIFTRERVRKMRHRILDSHFEAMELHGLI